MDFCCQPDDIVTEILKFSRICDVANIMLVCKRWKDIFSTNKWDSIYWKQKCYEMGLDQIVQLGDIKINYWKHNLKNLFLLRKKKKCLQLLFPIAVITHRMMSGSCIRIAWGLKGQEKITALLDNTPVVRIIVAQERRSDVTSPLQVIEHLKMKGEHDLVIFVEVCSFGQHCGHKSFWQQYRNKECPQDSGDLLHFEDPASMGRSMQRSYRHIPMGAEKNPLKYLGKSTRIY